MDIGGTIPWMESVESSLEQRPGKRLEQVFERYTRLYWQKECLKFKPRTKLFIYALILTVYLVSYAVHANLI
jgi:hypothetical protein